MNSTRDIALKALVSGARSVAELCHARGVATNDVLFIELADFLADVETFLECERKEWKIDA